MNRRTIIQRFERPVDLVNTVLNDIPGGGLFIETEEEFELGEFLWVNVCFSDIPEGIPLYCSVTWRRPVMKWRSALRPGIGVTIDPIDERRWSFVKKYVNGGDSSKRISGPRIATDIPTTITCNDFSFSATATNLGPGGVFVLTEAPLSVETRIEIDLALEEEEKPEHHYGRVAWRYEDTSNVGIGVAFQFRNPHKRNSVLAFMEKDTTRKLDTLHPGPYHEPSHEHTREENESFTPRSAEEQAIFDLLKIVQKKQARKRRSAGRSTVRLGKKN
ncbi:MAG: hypothetical protein GY854_30770 [Deltaproteobacteria bacterium]|nr:hypothetical protein [Deltaproteobacteria bacterium]